MSSCVDGVCGNVSAYTPTEISSMRQLSLKLCPGQVDNTAIGLRFLIGLAHAQPDSSAGYYKLVGVPPPHALAIRPEPDPSRSAIGAIAADSGPLKLYQCASFEGKRHRWCKIDWGGLTGWVSTKRLQQITSQ
jgi:hypothetical protein